MISYLIAMIAAFVVGLALTSGAAFMIGVGMFAALPVAVLIDDILKDI